MLRSPASSWVCTMGSRGADHLLVRDLLGVVDHHANRRVELEVDPVEVIDQRPFLGDQRLVGVVRRADQRPPLLRPIAEIDRHVFRKGGWETSEKRRTAIEKHVAGRRNRIKGPFAKWLAGRRIGAAAATEQSNSMAGCFALLRLTHCNGLKCPFQTLGRSVTVQQPPLLFQWGGDSIAEN